MMRRKIVFCTYPSLYSSIVLEKLLEAERIEVVGIVASVRQFTKDTGSIAAAIRMIRQSGIRYAIYYFVATHLSNGLGLFFSRKSVRQLAKQHNIPLHETKDINGRSGVQFIRRREPDALLAAHFNQRIKRHLLRVPEFGCLNIHPSLLPNYRGVDPVFYALLREEQKVGVTLHQMDAHFDEGVMLDQRMLSVQSGLDLMDVQAQLFSMGADIACDYIESAEFSVARNNEANDGDTVVNTGCYDSWPMYYVVKLFKGMGLELYRFSTLKKWLCS